MKNKEYWIIEESKCRNDPKYFLDKYCKIFNKENILEERRKKINKICQKNQF